MSDVRTCPGQYFAQKNLSLFIASLLHVFHVEAGTDENGAPVILSTDTVGGFLTSVIVARDFHREY